MISDNQINQINQIKDENLSNTNITLFRNDLEMTHQKKLLEIVIKHGYIDRLKIAIEMGFRDIFYRDLCSIAACHGSLNCLKYLHEELSFPINYLDIYLALVNGHLNCVIYLQEKGVQLTPSMKALAANRNNCCIVKYIRKHQF